jgi:hypothetical protein
LTRAFNFYGGYVQLNLKEKANLAENSIVTYYKQTIIELEMKNQILEQEIDFLKALKLKFYQEANEKD